MNSISTNGQAPPVALSEDLSISHLFSLSADFKLDASSASESSAGKLTELRGKVPVTTPWNAVQSEIFGSLTDALHSSLLETLGQGWKRYQALMDDARKSRKEPDVPILSTLAEHSIDSTLHPYVEIFFGPKSLNRIPFEVTLTTTIRGLQLGLKNGEIVSVQMGECEWSGKIATGSFTFIERHTEPLTLPGRIDLKRGIALVHE